MVTSEIPMRVDGSDLQRSAAWERAAQILDISPELARCLRTPQLECVSRHGSGSNSGGVASLHMATMSPGCEGTLLKVAVGVNCFAPSVASAAQELQLRAALAGCEYAGAALGLQLATSSISEQDLWHLARECAPVIVRMLGNDALLLPEDLASAAFARWTSEAAVQLGHKLRMPAVPAEDYCASRNELYAESVVCLTSLALEECSKKLRGSAVSVVGTGPLARACVQNLVAGGARIVAAADESGSLLDAGGLNIPDLLRHITAGGFAAEYPGATHGLHADAFTFPADVLLLCAPVADFAQGLRALGRSTIVVDVVDAFLRSDAEDWLMEHEVCLVDGTILGAGSIRAELTARQSGFSSKERHANLNAELASMWESIRKVARNYQLSLHAAALTLALQRFAQRERSSRP